MNTIEILNKCREQGIILTPKSNERLEIYGPKKIVTKEFLNTLKNHKHELIKILSVVNAFEGTIVADLNTALERQEDIYRVFCPYKGFERYVHPEVCKWHKEKNDKECFECEPDKRMIFHKRILH